MDDKMSIAAVPLNAGMSAAASRQRVVDWLKHCALFSHVGPPSLSRIAAECVSSTYAAGTTIFVPGTTSDGFYIVIFGSVALLLPGPGQTEKMVELVGPGESFGQAAMFLEIPFPVASRSLTETLLLHVPRKPMFDLLEQDTTLARKMLAGMALRMHRLIHDIEGYAFRTAASRIADYFMTTSSGSGPSFRLPVNKTVLASKLLIAPETISRVLKAWIKQGYVEVRGRQITIRAPDSLKEIARCDRS